MSDFDLTAEQIEFRDTVRAFVQREVKPAAVHPDRLQGYRAEDFARQLTQAAAMGLRTLVLSEAAGGAGADALTACLLCEELGAGDAGLAATLAHTAMPAPILFERLMTAAQRDALLPRFVAEDDFHLALGWMPPPLDTEWHYCRPGNAGEGVSARALPQPGGAWMLRGTLAGVPNAPLAGMLVVVGGGAAGGATGPVFLVPREAPGLLVADAGDVLHWHHGALGAVTFTDVRVPPEQVCELTPAVADSLGLAATLQEHAIGIGVARAAYATALEYAGLRYQGGQHIIRHEGVGLMLAEMAARLEAARALVWRAARARAAAPDDPGSVSLTRAAAAIVPELMHETARRAAEVFGAMGILRDMPLHRYVHDTRVYLHAAGGTTAAKLRLAEDLAGYQRS